MGIPAGVSRISLKGSIGSEIAETGFWVDSAPTTESAADDLAQSAWNGFLLTAYADWQILVRNDFIWNDCRAYCYPAGGPTAAVIGVATTSPSPGAGGGSMPLQTALVMTLLTGAAGRQRRGRMYLPASGMSLGTNHLLDNTAVTNIATAGAAWLSSLTPAAVVVSSVSSSSRPITEVRVDNKPDIQRRRANKMAATFSSTRSL